MNGWWMDDFISQCLADVPLGTYRYWAEKELRDHMESLCLSLTESGMGLDQARRETLRAMGEPDKLQKEYRAAWQRTLTGRMDALVRLLQAWAVMAVVHFPVYRVLLCICIKAVKYPERFWGRLLGPILNAMDYDLTVLMIELLPLGLAFAVGALCLGPRFRTESHPALLISAGLYLYWVWTVVIGGGYAVLFSNLCFRHMVEFQFEIIVQQYRWTFVLCILVGVVSGYLFERKAKRAAAA